VSDNDQLTDSAEFDLLRDSLSALAVPGPPPLDPIMLRGRTWRRHRRYGTGAVFLVCAGIAAALVVSQPAVPAAGPAAAPPARRVLGTIRTAAYRIVLHGDATASLTIDPTELIDAARLQSDLDQFGIPAKVKVGSFCTSDPAPAGLSQVVSYQSGDRDTITIDPTAMPPGTELSFGQLEVRMGIEMAGFGLIDKDSYTCSSIPPTSSPSSGAMYLMGASYAP
jgi:hypothetical protein